MLVHEALVSTARRLPHRTALIAGGRSWSFGRLDDDSDRLAVALQRLGVARGDRVAVLLDNSAEMVVALWGILKAGAVFTPIAHGSRRERVEFVLADAEPACLIAAASHPALSGNFALPCPILWVGSGDVVDGLTLDDVLSAPHQAPRDPGLIDQDLSLLIYTSGSTGRPKGVMMTHAAVRNNMWAIATYLGNSADDVVLCVLPLSFNYGLFQVLVGAREGYATVLERSFAFPYQVLQSVAEHRVTGFPAVPTMIASLVQMGENGTLDLSSLRYVTNAAAPVAPAHIRRLRQMLPGVAFFSMYGLTECTRVAYLDPARVLEKTGSVGRAIPNSQVTVVDEHGRRANPGQVGELVVRGANLMRGYWRRPEETAAVLRDGPLPGEKVLHTGDLFRMDADGDLFFVGRKDDVFKCRGEKVSPREIEAALCELTDVLEAAVIGVPDPVDGMAVKAFVVPRAPDAVTEAELRRHCRARLEAHLVPKTIELRASLPKTESGKIAKAALRDDTSQAALRADAAAPHTPSPADAKE